jgi:hypothetical protein
MREELGGLEIPLNRPGGREENLRLRGKDGVRAADFPKAMIVDEPPKKKHK